MALQREKRSSRFQAVVFIEQFPERDPNIVPALHLLYNPAERVADYLIAVSLLFIDKVYISSVNMAAYFEIHYVHVGEIFIHHQPIVLYAHIQFVDIWNLRQRFDSAFFWHGIYVRRILHSFLQRFIRSRHKFVQCYISAVLGGGVDMDNLTLVFGISQSTAYLCEQGRNIQQRVCLAAVADDKCNTVLVEYVATLEARRGIKIDFSCGVGRLANGILAAQPALVVLPVVSADRANYFHLVGREFCEIDCLGDELDAVYEDVQIIMQISVQYLAAFTDDILDRFGGLTGAYINLLQMRSAYFTLGKVFQLLQYILPFNRSSRHISNSRKPVSLRKQIFNGCMAERI